MKILQKLSVAMLISVITISTYGALKDKRIRLKNGKAKSNVTLNPSRTYRFVISGKEFSKLSIALQTKGGKIQVVIKSPSGKTLSNSTGRRFNIKKAEKGDYQIILKNIGNKLSKVYVKLGDIKGDSQ